MRLRVRTTIVPIRLVRRFGRLAPKLPALAIASFMSLVTALIATDARVEDGDETKPTVVYRHFV